MRSYFAKHYDAAQMATFLALERTPVYRTMHRLEESAETPAAQAARRRFRGQSEVRPADPERVDIIARLDEATKTTGLQVNIVIGIMNAMAAALGAQMPADLETQSTAFRPRSDRSWPTMSSTVIFSSIATPRCGSGGLRRGRTAAGRRMVQSHFAERDTGGGGGSGRPRRRIHQDQSARQR